MGPGRGGGSKRRRQTAGTGWQWRAAERSQFGAGRAGHAGQHPERDGAKALLTGVLGWFTWLRLLWVDGGYSGPAFAHWVKGLRRKLVVEVVKRSDDVKGFRVLPRRWVVERTFRWLMRHRRVVRDHEASESSAEA